MNTTVIKQTLALLVLATLSSAAMAKGGGSSYVSPQERAAREARVAAEEAQAENRYNAYTLSNTLRPALSARYQTRQLQTWLVATRKQLESERLSDFERAELQYRAIEAQRTILDNEEKVLALTHAASSQAGVSQEAVRALVIESLTNHLSKELRVTLDEQQKTFLREQIIAILDLAAADN